MIDFLKYFDSIDTDDQSLESVEDLRMKTVAEYKRRRIAMGDSIKHDVETALADVLRRTKYKVSHVNDDSSIPTFILLDYHTNSIADHMDWFNERCKELRSSLRYCVTVGLQCEHMYDRVEMVLNDETGDVMTSISPDIIRLNGTNKLGVNRAKLIAAMCNPSFGIAMSESFKKHAVPYYEWVAAQSAVVGLCVKFSDFAKHKSGDAACADNVVRFERLLKTEFANDNLILHEKCRNDRQDFVVKLHTGEEYFLNPGFSMRWRDKKMPLNDIRMGIRGMVNRDLERYKEYTQSIDCVTVRGCDIEWTDGVARYSDNPMRNRFYHDEIYRLREKYKNKDIKKAK